MFSDFYVGIRPHYHYGRKFSLRKEQENIITKKVVMNFIDSIGFNGVIKKNSDFVI